MTASAGKPALAEPTAAAGPSAATGLKTIIELAPEITVSGLSINLDGRYSWRPAPVGQQGWILEVRSDVEPKVRRVKK